MKNLYKIAVRFENQLRKQASGNLVAQLSDLVSAASVLWKNRQGWSQALDVNDPNDPYADEAETNEKAQMAQKAIKATDNLYFACLGLKNDTLAHGMSTQEMARRQKQILTYLSVLNPAVNNVKYPGGNYQSMIGMWDKVRAANERLVPAYWPAPKPAQPAESEAPVETATEGNASTGEEVPFINRYLELNE